MDVYGAQVRTSPHQILALGDGQMLVTMALAVYFQFYLKIRRHRHTMGRKNSLINTSDIYIYIFFTAIQQPSAENWKLKRFNNVKIIPLFFDSVWTARHLYHFQQVGF